MNKVLFAILALSISTAAEAKCLKGKFEIPMKNRSYMIGDGEQTVTVEDGKVQIEFDLKIADDGDSAQFVSRILNPSEPVVLKDQKTMTVDQMVTPDDLILARAAVRCPCLVFQDRNVNIEFAMMSEDKIKSINYFDRRPLKVDVISVAETCQ